jgi:glycosyltransferase involved in cell wall biosynthesis
VQEHQTGAVSARWRFARWAEDRIRALQGRLFDANLTVTETLGRRLFGDPTRFEAVPAGVNLSLFRPGLPRDLRRELNLPANAVVFVHAGVLEANRATDVPIRAFARALQRDGRLWLLMPGKGSQLAELRRLARDLGVENRVWLPGYVPYGEVPRIFAAADAGLSYLPVAPYYEGQPPMKVMEYLGAGLPVIASDVSSHRLLIRHGENGLLAEPGEQAFAEALVQFASDAALQSRLRAATEPSVAHLTYDRIAMERVLPIYRRLLATR